MRRFLGDLIRRCEGNARASKDKVAYWVKVLEGGGRHEVAGAGANT